MTNRRAIVVLLFSASVVLSYEGAALPDFSGNFYLPANSIEASFYHRFYSPISSPDTWNTFFGLGAGVNVRIHLIYTPLPGLHADAGFTADGGEYEIGASYSLLPAAFPVGGQLALQLSTERIYNPASGNLIRQGDAFYQFLLQSKPIFNRLILTAAPGYGVNEGKIGLGAGAEVVVIDNVSVFGELSPVRTKPIDDALYGTMPMSYGVRITTYGHQFLLFAGNSALIGARKYLYGAENNDFKVGFEIKRFHKFGEN